MSALAAAGSSLVPSLVFAGVLGAAALVVLILLPVLRHWGTQGGSRRPPPGTPPPAPEHRDSWSTPADRRRASRRSRGPRRR